MNQFHRTARAKESRINRRIAGFFRRFGKTRGENLSKTFGKGKSKCTKPREDASLSFGAKRVVRVARIFRTMNTVASMYMKSTISIHNVLSLITHSLTFGLCAASVTRRKHRWSQTGGSFGVTSVTRDTQRPTATEHVSCNAAKKSRVPWKKSTCLSTKGYLTRTTGLRCSVSKWTYLECA